MSLLPLPSLLDHLIPPHSLPESYPLTLLATLALLLAAHLAISTRDGPKTTRRVLALLAKFVLHYGLIVAEEKIYRNLLHMRLDIPRNMDELLSDPEYYLFDKLRRKGTVVPNDAKFTRAERMKLIETEPDKNATAGSLRLLYRRDDEKGEEKELKVFVKFQSGRGLPRWLQALRAAAEPGVCREIDFYNKVRPSISPNLITTPMCYLCEKRSSVNYVFAALEYVELGTKAKVVTDWRGANVAQVEAMMDRIVRVHARYLGVFHDDPSVNWIPARRGLEFAGFVDTFLDRKDPYWTPALWLSLKKRFENEPLTFVHGDCRPGNMMFVENAMKIEVEDVIFGDFEAVNVAPPLWDLVYCTTLGWPAKMRRAHQARLVERYLARFNELVGEESEGRSQQKKHVRRKTITEARLDVAHLTLVLGFVSRTIRKTGFWNKQGNTSKDQIAWLCRVCLSVMDLRDDDLVAALEDAPSSTENGQLWKSQLASGLKAGARRELEAMMKQYFENPRAGGEEDI